MLNNIIVLIYLIFLVSCSTIPNDYNNIPFSNKYELTMRVNSTEFMGAGVVPKSDRYDIQITSKRDITRFSIGSKHRQNHTDNALDIGWTGPKTYTYTIWPDVYEKENGMGILRVAALNDNVPNNNRFGVVVFEDERFKLPAELSCNGWTKKVNGTSVCLAPLGTEQQIRFENPVVIAAKEKCPYKDLNTMTIKFTPKVDECEIIFKESSTRKLHRIFVFGY